MAEVLKAAGFRKSGAKVTRTLEEVAHLVTLQSSVASTSQSLRATINLGVWLTVLEGDGKPDMWSAHWRERIGALMPEKKRLLVGDILGPRSRVRCS